MIRVCGNGTKHLIRTANRLADALDSVEDQEDTHRVSRDIRHVLAKTSQDDELIASLKALANHEEGMLNSIKSDLIQLAYDINSNEKNRVDFIEALSATIEFAKALILTKPEGALNLGLYR